MAPYAEAINRLVIHPWSGRLDLPNILSVLRGPDTDDNLVKVTVTAPLRLYLLGKEAYKDAGYYPAVSRVSRTLPTVSPNDHFNRHIYQAVNLITSNHLPRAK